MIKAIKRSWVSLIAFLLLTVMATPVMAYTYYAFVYLSETAGTSYAMYPALVPNNTTWQITQGYISATGLNTRVRTDGSTVPHMLADDKLLFAYPLPANTTQPLRYTTGESALTDYDIITGRSGYFYKTDDADMELSSNFTMEWDGYIDTAAANNKNLEYKKEAIRTFIDGANTITSGITTTEPVRLIPSAYAGWVDVNVAQYLPYEATGVILHIKANTKDVGVRMNGSTDARNNDFNHNWAMIGIDSSQIFEVYLEDATCELYLVGYTDSSWIYKTNAIDRSLDGGFGAWTNIDVTDNTSANAVGVVVEIENLNVASQTSGVRKDGSADARNGDMDAISHYFAVIGLDTATEIFEMWAQSADVNTYLIGYVESGATFATNATDKSLAGAAAWTNIDCSVEAPSADFLVFEVYEAAAGAYTYGFRKDGSTEAVIEESDGRHAWVVVECSSTQIVEGYVSDLNVDFFLVGYITSGALPPFAVSVSATGIASGEKTVTVSGTANYPQWATGNVLTYDGNDELRNATANWRVADGTGTIVVWYRRTSAASMQFISSSDEAANNRIFGWGFSDNKLAVYQNEAGAENGVQTTADIVGNADGNWHTATISSDGAAWYIYYDGISKAVSVYAGANNGNWLDSVTLRDSIVIGYLGRLAKTLYFSGTLGDILYYSDCKTPAEVLAIHNGYRNPTNLVAAWLADEGAGNVSDFVGSYTMTVTGATWATSTYTSGSTGRLCDYTIQVDSSRWGKNLKGVSVPNNANQWNFTQGNVSPYLGYYKHYVGGALIAWYQPVSYIVGTALPDRQGAAEDAVIVWGTNEIGIAITMGAFTIADPDVGTGEQIETVGAAGEVNAGGENWMPPDTELVGIPFLRPTVRDLAIIVGDPEWLWWLFMSLLTIIVSMAVVAKYTQHLWMTAATGVIIAGGCAAAMMIQPAIIVVIFGIMLIPMLMERKPSW